MKLRTLFVLLIALAVLGALVRVNQKKQAEREPVVSHSDETLLSLSNLNDIARFTVTTGTQTVSLARSEDRWVVETLWKYPADFSRVTDNLRKLAETKCGEELRGGTDNLSDFGLDEAATNVMAQPAVLAFYGANGKVIRKLAIGSPRMAAKSPYPESMYMRLDDGPVRLVPAYIPNTPRSGQGWINNSLLTIPGEDVNEVTVTPTNGAAFHLARKMDGSFSLDGLQTNEVVKSEGASALAGGFSQLFLTDVADPSLKPEASGLDKPYVVSTKTREGFVYTVQLGHAAPDNLGTYAHLDVAYEKPPAPSVTDTNAAPKALEAKATSDAAKAAAEQARLSKWTFIIPDSSAQNMMMPREQLVTAATNVLATATNDGSSFVLGPPPTPATNSAGQ